MVCSAKTVWQVKTQDRWLCFTNAKLKQMTKVRIAEATEPWTVVLRYLYRLLAFRFQTAPILLAKNDNQIRIFLVSPERIEQMWCIQKKHHWILQKTKGLKLPTLALQRHIDQRETAIKMLTGYTVGDVALLILDYAWLVPTAQRR